VDTLGLRRVVELHRAEEVAVIGHGDRGHLLLDHQIHQLEISQAPSSREYIGMAMQVDEGVWDIFRYQYSRRGVWGGRRFSWERRARG